MANAPPAAPFALAPALAGANAPIDYSTGAGQAIYADATSVLPYTFEGSDSSLPAFLQAIRDRSDRAGWDDIFTITVGQDANNNNIDRHLLTQYGEINLSHVRSNAIADYAGQHVRNAQISHQIYQCLRKSISKDVSERLVTETDSFYINGSPDGPSFIMTLIETYFVKTNATPSNLRIKLSEAHVLITELDYNIDKFNTELNSYVQKLSANGERTQDLFAHLTKAYKLVPDKAFQQYIRAKIDTHNDGTANLSTVQLMAFAKKKYDELMEDKVWMLKDETEQQLIALTAQLQQIHKSNRPKPAKLRNSASSSNYHEAKVISAPKKPSASTMTSKQDKWAWKSIAPKSGAPTKKTVSGKPYFWCEFHRKWTLHKPDDCRLNPNAKDKLKTKPKDSSNANPSATVGLSAILSEDPFDNE